jgi:trigger factor
MRSTLEPLEGNKVKLSVEVDEAEFDKAVDSAFRKIAKEVRIPGFRPGKAPRKLLESRLGSHVGREQAMQDALPDWYQAAVLEHDVDVIAPPEIDITGGHDTGPVLFDAVVEVRPSIQVPGYGGIRVELDRPQVDEDALQAQLDRMRQVEATLGEVDRPAIDGDTVTIDIAGRLDDEPQPGLTADDYAYTLGSGAVTPEVDEQLAGAKAGDILEFEATHPDSEEERTLTFRILVKQVQETVLPELTDEWAERSSEFSTVEELRSDLAERMLTVRRAQAQMALREKVGEALAQLVDDEIPEPLVAEEMQHRVQDLAMRVQAQGMQLDQWLAMSGQDPQEFSDQLRETAAVAVKVDLALRAVADAEEIDADDDELEAELVEVSERVGTSPAEVREQLERGGRLSAVRSDIRKRKALEWLLERVEVVDDEGQPIDRAELEMPPEDDDHDDDPAEDQ